MKKRSKLDLSTELNQAKSQAAGFGPEVTVDPATEAKRSQRRASGEAKQPATAVEDGAINSSRALIVTSIALTAVATALLFLLKRR